MKRLMTAAIMTMLLTASAWADTIKSGMGTVEGSTHIGSSIENYDKSDENDSNTYSFALGLGLFVADNVELGFQLDGATQDFEEVDKDDITQWSFMPFGLLHIPASDEANLFIGGGAGLTGMENTSLDPSGIKIKGVVGLEYFFNPNIALTFNFSMSWLDVDYDIETEEGTAETISDKVTTYDNTIGLKLFF